MLAGCATLIAENKNWHVLLPPETPHLCREMTNKKTDNNNVLNKNCYMNLTSCFQLAPS